MVSLLRTRVTTRFSCLGERCEDTCCQNWSMQVDDATLLRYRTAAPELMAFVEAAQETPHIMRKNPETGFCLKYEGGLCGIHKQYGDAMLGDACHFYPRVTRSLGVQPLMTASLSCPEVARLALFDDAPCVMDAVDYERLPQTLKDYLPTGMKPDDALAIHRLFLEAAVAEKSSAETNYLRIGAAARALERIEIKDRAQALPLYLKLAGEWLPPAQMRPVDPFNLLHALAGLIVASHKPMSQRLAKTVSEMEQALAVTLDWKNVLIDLGDTSMEAYAGLQAGWNEHAAYYAPLLKRWLQMQFSVALFPYAGLGASLEERITIIGVRLATIKLALMCSCSINDPVLPQDVVVRVIQSLARFLDHLGDPAFSMQIYGEAGWQSEAGMRGLLNA